MIPFIRYPFCQIYHLVPHSPPLFFSMRLTAFNLCKFVFSWHIQFYLNVNLLYIWSQCVLKLVQYKENTITNHLTENPNIQIFISKWTRKQTFSQRIRNLREFPLSDLSTKDLKPLFIVPGDCGWCHGSLGTETVRCKLRRTRRVALTSLAALMGPEDWKFLVSMTEHGPPSVHPFSEIPAN